MSCSALRSQPPQHCRCCSRGYQIDYVSFGTMDEVMAAQQGPGDLKDRRLVDGV